MTTAPRSVLPRGAAKSPPTDRPMWVPPYRSTTLSLALLSATSADRCDSAGVSRVNEVENAKTSGRTPFCRNAAARIRCR